MARLVAGPAPCVAHRSARAARCSPLETPPEWQPCRADSRGCGCGVRSNSTYATCVPEPCASVCMLHICACAFNIPLGRLFPPHGQVTPRLVSMGMPGAGANALDKLGAALNDAHGSAHYMVWNFSEMSYDYSMFNDQARATLTSITPKNHFFCQHTRAHTGGSCDEIAARSSVGPWTRLLVQGSLSLGPRFTALTQTRAGHRCWTSNFQGTLCPLLR